MKVVEQILVTVRTYPTPSTGNRETVCTGGITDSGEWRRLYPVPLRFLPSDQQFKVWDVISVSVQPARSDSRVESRRPHLPSLRITRSLGTWASRIAWVHPTAYSSMRELVMDGSSLAPVAIKEVMELEAKSVSSVWDRSRKSKIEALGLFDEPKPLEKIPFEFRFRWQDYDGIEHDSLVISWEMAQTWRQYRDRYSDPIAEMKAKLLGDYFGPERNPSFFMGNHSRFRNTFMVCGWFIPPKSEIGNEFLW